MSNQDSKHINPHLMLDTDQCAQLTAYQLDELRDHIRDELRDKVPNKLIWQILQLLGRGVDDARKIEQHTQAMAAFFNEQQRKLGQ